jgi:hypothetical protein
MGARSDPLAAAEGALARGSWWEARAEFERAIEGGAGPEAYEGLAMTAFFLDEASLVFDARERAYAGYREAGRAVDAARVATALAWDYRIFRGQAAIGDGWLARARRLLQDVGPTAEQGWLRSGRRLSRFPRTRRWRASAARRPRRWAASWASWTSR